MGWAIKRPDGTYRAWNAITQDDALQPGETWEELAVMPPTMLPKGPLPDDRLADKAALSERAERARTLATLDFLNDVRADKVTEEGFNDRVKFYIDRL